MSRVHSSGLAMLEFLVVTALALTLAAQALPQLRRSLLVWRLESASAELGHILRQTRQHAFHHGQVVRLEAHGSGTPSACLLLHDGPAGACQGCTGPIHCTPGTQGLARSATWPPGITLHASPLSQLWHPGAGTVTPTGTYRLVIEVGGAPGGEVRHVVNLLGRIRACSTDVRLRAHAPC